MVDLEIKLESESLFIESNDIFNEETVSLAVTVTEGELTKYKLLVNKVVNQNIELKKTLESCLKDIEWYKQANEEMSKSSLELRQEKNDQKLEFDVMIAENNSLKFENKKLKDKVDMLEVKQKEDEFKNSNKVKDKELDHAKDTKFEQRKQNIKIEWKTRQEVQQIKKELRENKDDRTEYSQNIPRAKRYKKSSKDWEVETSEGKFYNILILFLTLIISDDSDENGDQNHTRNVDQLETNEEFNQNFQKYLEDLEKIQGSQLKDEKKNKDSKFDINDFKKIKKETLYDQNQRENMGNTQENINNSFDCYI